MAVIYEEVQGCVNIFVDTHGRVDKAIASISFEDVLRAEVIEQEKQTLVKEARPSVLVHQKKCSLICFMTLWHAIWRILAIKIHSL
jgi:hypothetical protein